MEQIKRILEKKYLETFKENPQLYIGVELEYPIVHLNNLVTDVGVTRLLMEELIISSNFEVTQYDDNGCPIALCHRNGDAILFEVSYNTLEFAFAKANTIQEIETRLNQYVAIIQPFLRRHGHELQAKGINPNWSINDNRPVKSSRYRMLSQFLQEGSRFEQCHRFSDYGAYICGNQVQFDVPRSQVIRVLNVFNQIEAAKAYLFANSALEEVAPDMTITRDFFWEQSMHGIFKENIGVYHREFSSEDDYLDYMLDSAMFSVCRNEHYHYFDPIRVRDYFEGYVIRSLDTNSEIIPLPTDIDFHRSYHYQEVTSRGTIEFRSVCTQDWENTFLPIAFQLGLLVNLDLAEKMVKESRFYTVFEKNADDLRKRYSKKIISNFDREIMHEFCRELIMCAKDGLMKRGNGEEVYMDLLQSRLFKRREQS